MARKLTNKSGERSGTVKSQVVKLRDGKSPISWAAIAEKLGVSPRTVRRIYDEAKGAEAHFASRPLPGGRNRQVEAEEAEA